MDSGIVHSQETTATKVHESHIWDELLDGNERSTWADKCYVGAEREATFTKDGKVWRVMRKAPRAARST